jgi:hypothetical protein
MYRLKILCVLAVIMQASGTAIADQHPTYLCIAEQATGFKWEQGSWRSVDFKVAADKFFVLPRGADGYLVRGVGQGASPADATCTGDDTYLDCHSDTLEDYRISIKRLRFLRTYLIGYVEGLDHSEDTPMVEIGRCSPVQ